MRSKRGRSGPQGKYPWWILTLSILGGISVVGVIVTLFFAFGRRPSSFHVTEAPPVESMEFLRSIAGNAGSPLRSGGSVRLLNNGEFFPALMQAIRNARQTINFSVYIWEPGRVSDEVLAALTERARAGVTVRVLLDGLGGMKAPEDDLDVLRAAGGKVESFRSPRLGQFTRFHKRNHRRAIVMDGTLGFTGGSAVADKWLGSASTEEEWRDLMVEVTGPLAATLQSAFTGAWANSTGEILSGDAIFPPAPELLPANGQHVTYHVGLASAPSSEDHPLRLFYYQTFASARRRLYITTPYFVPDQATRRVVAERARKGVDVRILLPDEHTDADMIRLTSHHYFQELLEAGVKVYEYQPTFMHSKTVVVDGQWSVVGSANLDIRSKELNEENVLGILDAGFGRQMEETFMGDLARAQPILLEDWRRRSALRRGAEWVASRFAEQY